MSSTAPLDYSAPMIDFSGRYAYSTTVVASPAGAAATIIASVTIPTGIQVVTGVELVGWAAFTVGTNGVSTNLQIRQTLVSGTVIAASGAVTEVATDLDEITVAGFDAAPAVGQIYKLVMTVASGSAASTVSAVFLRAFVI